VAIFYGYMEGASGSGLHSRLMKDRDEGLHCSRQAVEGMYLRFGEYLWKNFVYEKLASSYSEANVTEDCPTVSHLVVYYLDVVRQAIEGELNYSAFRAEGVEFGSMETVQKLILRSKSFSGLPAKTFHFHFAYVSFIETMENVVEKGRFSMDDVYIMLLSEFEKNPI